MNEPSYSKDYLEPNSPLVQPVHIFLNHTYVMHLTKQNRSEDVDHSAFLNRLWNREKILLSDIKTSIQNLILLMILGTVWIRWKKMLY